MGDRWGPDGPPEEAYSRVTDPERFAPVIEAADALVQELLASYDVAVDEVEPDLPDGAVDAVRAVALLPKTGAPLRITTTSFPGIWVQAGYWWSGSLPVCGCDACDETAAGCIQQLQDNVRAIVAGRMSERLTSRPRRIWTGIDSSSKSQHGWSALSRDEFRDYAAIAPPGEYRWPPWRLRTPH